MKLILCCRMKNLNRPMLWNWWIFLTYPQGIHSKKFFRINIQIISWKQTEWHLFNREKKESFSSFSFLNELDQLIFILIWFCKKKIFIHRMIDDFLFPCLSFLVFFLYPKAWISFIDACICIWMSSFPGLSAFIYEFLFVDRFLL